MLNTFKSALFALVMVSIMLISGNSAFAWGSKELENERAAIFFLREVDRGGYKVISTADLKKWIDDKKEMLIVDTMPPEDNYNKNHIPGAKAFEFPIPEMTTIDPARKAEFEKLLGSDKQRTIVFYCGFTKCTRSHNAAMWAVKLGYKNVYRQPGGIKGWKEASYPMESSK